MSIGYTWEEGSKGVRYHTTFKDIAVSVVVLISCAILTLYGMVYIGMRNPSEVLSEYIISKLQDSREITFEADGINRTFLKDLTIINPKILTKEQTLGTAEKLTLEGGIPTLLESIFGKGTLLSVSMTNAKLSVDTTSMMLGKQNTSSTSLPVWLGKNTIQLQGNALEGSVTIPAFSTAFKDATFSLDLIPNTSIPSLQAQIKTLKLASDAGDLNFDQTMVNLTEKGSVTVTSSMLEGKTSETNASAENLIARAQIKDIFNPIDALSVTLSASALQASNQDTKLSIPNLNGSFEFSQGSIQDATFSYNRLALLSSEYDIQAPTATIKGTWDPEGISFAAATKAGDTLTVRYKNTISLSLDTLALTARYLLTKQLDTKLALSHVDLTTNEVNTNLTSINLNATATLGDGFTFDGITADLESMVSASSGPLDIQGNSSLFASATYEKKGSSLTASVDLPDLNSSFTTVPTSLQLSLQRNSEGSQLQAEFAIDGSLDVRSVYDVPETGKGSLYLTARVDHLELGSLNPTIVRYAPFLQPYYQDKTSLIGNINFQSQSGSGTVFPFDGTIAVDLALQQAKIGKVELDAGFTLQADVAKDLVDVNSLTIATSGYRLAYSGKTNLEALLPSGVLDLYRTTDGQLMGSINFSDAPASQYKFDFTTPLQPTLSIEGTIQRTPELNLKGDASLSIFNSDYPFTFLFQPSTLQLDVQQESALQLSTNFAPPINIDISANQFTLPNKGFFANGIISGDFLFTYENLSLWSIKSDNLSIGNVEFQGRTYDLQTSVTADPSNLSLPNILLQDGQVQYQSKLSYEGTEFLSLIKKNFIAPFTAVFTLHLQDQQKIGISLIGTDDRINTVISLQNLQLDRFFKQGEGISTDLKLIGYTDLHSIIDADGQLSLAKGETQVSTKITANNNSFSLFDTTFKQGDISYSGNVLSLQDDKLSSDGSLSHIRHLSYIDQKSNVDYSLSIDLLPIQNLFDLPDLIAKIREGHVTGTLSLSNILFYGDKAISDGLYSLDINLPSIGVKGDNLDVTYNIDTQHLKAEVQPEFGIGLSAQGSLANKDFGIEVSNVYFPLNFLNRTFLKPIFSFNDGILEGDVFVGGKKDDLKFYGQMWVDSSHMQLFWLPQDVITVKNITATLDGDKGVTPTIPFFTTNTTTGKTIEGYGSFAVDLDGLKILDYDMHMDSGDQMLYVQIPMQGLDVDIRSYAGGIFNLHGVGFETWLSGDVTIQDTSISMGIKDLPYWYVAHNNTSTKFKVVTGKNVSFFYPNTPNPFLKATITENQEINFSYDHLTKQFDIDGNLAFRSGEFYYFQKNFFITEGSLALHTDALSGVNTIQPIINMRAKLTDFDTDGNRVDIYLVLRESSLTNLNPQFESTPPKDVNEILEILGQSILPTGAYGQVNLYSVASLAAAATDVASRLGYIDATQSTALTDSIRISLGLDMFSIRSNILQNILIDALPGSNLDNLSPLARYLNNTSIFMGKYIGRQFFLQALIHLTAEDSAVVTRSFISPDLSLDVELSLDWQNPLGTFSFFTQPDELSFTNILDTFGFSVTRRFVLR